jgi:cobalamin synthase
MNKTQKGVWLNLVGTLLVLASALFLTIQIGIRHRLPERIWIFIWALLFILVTVIGIILVCKKQSPAEPESDERDNQIKQRAWVAAFISVWPVFLAASVIPQFFVGLDGSVPVWSLPIVTVLLFYIVLFVYSIAVLIQYGRGAKGEKS